MATTPEIADAVVASLNATLFVPPFTARRAWLPVHDLGEMDQIQVTVVPTTRTLSTVRAHSAIRWWIPSARTWRKE